jgi:phosphonate transport system substrate-binding protein
VSPVQPPPGPLVLGAVAYEPRVVTIWEGFKAWLGGRGLPFDYVLYSNYERLVESLLDGEVDVAWNSPLAWVRARRLAAGRGRRVHAIAMRDTDCDLASVVVARPDSGIRSVGDLRGRTIGVGALDSPQATLLPLSLIRASGLTPGLDVVVRHFDVLAGKHGDHVGGERDAAIALMRGDVDAACMIEGNLALFRQEGVLPPDSRVVARTPPFDHCNLTVTDGAPRDLVERFHSLLLSMSYDDPEVRPLLDLEGLRAWRPGRDRGYAQLETAVDDAGFYDTAGAVTETAYRY